MKSEADVDCVGDRMVEVYYDGIKVVMVAWHTIITTTTYLHGTPHMLVGERCKDSMWAGSIIHPITGRQHVIGEGKRIRGSTKNIVIAVVVVIIIIIIIYSCILLVPQQLGNMCAQDRHKD